MLMYGAVVWWKRATDFEAARQKLGHVQRLACLSITGCVRSTPTAALEVLLYLPPLHLVVEQFAMAA